MKYYILFGPPGAGKGTQATSMVEKYNLHHISTGALLRKEIAAGSELGLKAKSLIEAGALVPDEVVEGMIESEFKTVTGVDGFLLDVFYIHFVFPPMCRAAGRTFSVDSRYILADIKQKYKLFFL